MDANDVGQHPVERVKCLLVGKPDGGLPVSADVGVVYAVQELKCCFGESVRVLP